MTKFFAYNVRDDELLFINQWGKDHGIEVTSTSETLDEKTIAQAAGYDGISCLQTIPYDAELFKQFNQLGIKYLALRNVGTDNVDLQAAKENGVKVTNVPAYSPESIAEFAVTNALYLSRKVGYMQSQLKDHQEFHFSVDFMGKLIKEQTIGIIGTGRIGAAAAKMFKGLEANVIAFDVYQNPELADVVTYVDSIEEVLKQSDIIDFHIPATKENYHLINSDSIQLMKPGVIIINTARGAIIDMTALLAGLKSGQIGAAGIDTFENETADLQNSRSTAKFTDEEILELAALPNTLVTPHSAFHTETAVKNMVNISLNNLDQLVETDDSKDLVN